MIGRYISSDPIGIAGGMNTFNYVGQSPVMYSDPEGLQSVPMSVPGLPITIPPVAIPGTSENKQWVGVAGQAIGHYCDIAGTSLWNILCIMSTDTPKLKTANMCEAVEVGGQSLNSESGENSIEQCKRKCDAAMEDGIKLCNMLTTRKAREQCYSQNNEIYAQCLRKCE